MEYIWIGILLIFVVGLVLDRTDYSNLFTLMFLSRFFGI